MKRISILTCLVLGVLFIGFNQLNSYPTGAPAGYSGSPADGQTCANCHGGTATTVSNVLTTNVPTVGYTPGQSYTITVAIAGSSARKGFEVSPQNNTGTMVGTIASGTGSTIVGSKYVTHTSAKTSNPSTWTFTWTAPAKGTGTVNIYGAFVNGYSTILKQVISVQEANGLPIPPTVSATNVSELSATAANIDASINANGRTFNAAFQYKDSMSSIWNTVTAVPGTVSGNTPTNIFYTVTNLTANAYYQFRACAWNIGDTVWGATKTFKINSATSINENKNNLVFHVFPNPANDFLQVDFTLFQSSNTVINLTSIDGKIIRTLLDNQLSKGSNSLKLNVNDCKAGVYFLQINANNNTNYKKIIIQ
jgi:hypothetical protein